MNPPPSREVTLFSVALELPAEKRTAYLAEACADDPALRLRLEALLRVHEDAITFLEHQAPGSPESPMGAEPPDPTVSITEKSIGGTIRYFGDYQLLEEIARGGMGVVFKARQTTLNRTVALKTILAGKLASSALVQRFHTEAEAAANLKHANIVAIHEVGEHEGQHYFSMDYIEGQNLAERMRAGLMPLKAAADCVQTIARAIHYAHQRGVLHRDLKPSNILLDRHGQPHVTDFGLAKLVEHESTLTQSQDVMGTPSYMAPEQAAGERQLTTAADIYSLGAILYELLTGRPPFRAGTALETMRQVMEQEPKTPSLVRSNGREETDTLTSPEARSPKPKLDRTRGLPTAAEVLDRDLETICLKCLHKDPAGRYGSAEALAEDLARWRAGAPILARPVSQPERLWRWCRHNPKTAVLSGAVILLLLTVAIGSSLAAVRIRRAQRVATEELFHSYLAQASARRRDSREGQRFDSLEAVGKAAPIHSSLELRNEAIACLALTDVRFSDAHESSDSELELWDADFELRAFRVGGGRVSVRRIDDNREVALLPSIGAEAQWPSGFSPGGHFLAVSYVNGRNVVWDVNQQQPAISEILQGSSADFSADGQTVIVPCQDGQLRRFGLNPIRPLPSVPVNPRYHGIKLRPQGDWLAGYELNKAEVEVCDLRDGSLVRTLPHPSHIGTFSWSSDGIYLAVGCDSGRIFIWNVLTGEKQKELEGHEDSVVSVGFSHSGSLLASSSWDDQFRLWDLAAGRSLLTARGWSFQAMFSADDRRIGFVQRARKTGSLELTQSSVFRRLNCKPSPLRGSWSADVSPNGRLVAAAFQEGIRIWTDYHTGEPFFLPAGLCRSVIFTPDGTGLITCGESGIARWPLQFISGAGADDLRIGPLQTIRGRGDLNYAALSRNGRWIAAANPGAPAVSIYEVPHPTNHFRLVSHPWIQSPAFSPDGRWVAAGNFRDAEVNVWDFESRRVVFTLRSRPALVGFSPNNRWLFTTGANYDLWETGSWKHRYTITRPASEAGSSCLAFSPDATTLAITSDARVIQLIIAETGQVLANLEAPRTAKISFLRFSPDGSQLIALEWDQQVQVWDLRRLRAELAKLNLDWNAPPIPEAAASNINPKPLHISLEEPPR